MLNHLCMFGTGHHEEHFCKIIFNLDQPIKKRYLLSRALMGPLFGRVEQFVKFWQRAFCEIILILDKRFRGCQLKDFLSRALAALVFSGPEQFMQF